MYKVSFVPEAASRLLLPRRRREDLRPQLRRLRKSLESLNQVKTIAHKIDRPKADMACLVLPPQLSK